MWNMECPLLLRWFNLLICSADILLVCSQSGRLHMRPHASWILTMTADDLARSTQGIQQPLCPSRRSIKMTTVKYRFTTGFCKWLRARNIAIEREERSNQGDWFVHVWKLKGKEDYMHPFSTLSDIIEFNDLLYWDIIHFHFILKLIDNKSFEMD